MTAAHHSPAERDAEQGHGAPGNVKQAHGGQAHGGPGHADQGHAGQAHGGQGHADTCVAKVPIFSALSPAQQLEVAASATPVTLERGERLHGPDDRVGRLFVLHEGRVLLTRSTASGREHLIRSVGPGEAVGEHGFLTGQRPEYAVDAAEHTQLCVFENRALTDLVTRYPAISVSMLRSLSERLQQADERLALARAEVPTRLARYLLDLPMADTPGAGAGAAAPAVRWSVPKREVAALLDTTPESLSRALARLTRDGLVHANGDVLELRDLDALEALAQE